MEKLIKYISDNYLIQIGFILFGIITQNYYYIIGNFIMFIIFATAKQQQKKVEHNLIIHNKGYTND